VGRLRARVFFVVTGLVAVASIAVAARVVWPRIEHRRRLAAAIADVEAEYSDPPPPRSGGVLSFTSAAVGRLLSFEEPEAALALARVYRHAGSLRSDLQLAVELHAATESVPDPRLVRELEALARDASVDEAQRLVAFYLLEELRAPTYPEPEGFAIAGARVCLAPDVKLGEIPEKLGATSLPVEVDPELAGVELGTSIDDRPWRALIQVASASLTTLEVRAGRVRLVRREPWSFELHRSSDEVVAEIASVLGKKIALVPPAKLEAARLGAKFDTPTAGLHVADALKALRALAAFNGCSVHAEEGYEVRKP
jgi:hypothetical protein